MKQTIDEQIFIDCENISENSAIYDFNTKVLKHIPGAPGAYPPGEPQPLRASFSVGGRSYKP